MSGFFKVFKSGEHAEMRLYCKNEVALVNSVYDCKKLGNRTDAHTCGNYSAVFERVLDMEIGYMGL